MTHERCLPRHGDERKVGRTCAFLEVNLDLGAEGSGGQEAGDLLVGQAPELAALRTRPV
jgi:hypothetical protein